MSQEKKFIPAPSFSSSATLRTSPPPSSSSSSFSLASGRVHYPTTHTQKATEFVQVQFDPEQKKLYHTSGSSYRRRKRTPEELRQALEDASKGKPQVECAACGTKISPEWRFSANGVDRLCNRCGIKEAKETKRAKAMQERTKDVMSIRNLLNNS